MFSRKILSSILSISKKNASFSTSCKFLKDTKLKNEMKPVNDVLTSNFFEIEEKPERGYAIFRLNKAPVNSFNLEYLTALNIQLEKFEKSKNINGIIVTSSLPNIFSAGLDLMELYNPREDRLRQFWSSLQEYWIRLYGSNKIYIAAINGHSIAGGCLTVLSCDYRIMAKGPYKIGLSETKLGVKAPFWVADIMINTIGFRKSEIALQNGILFSTEEALAANLVDELVDEKDLIAKAEEQMIKWCKIPTIARQLTKFSMRKDTVQNLINQRLIDTDSFVDFVNKDHVQQSVKAYLATLKKP